MLTAVDAGGGNAYISFDMAQAWGGGALDVLVQQGLLKPASVAHSVECHGCEERCYSDVVRQSSSTGNVRAFVVCEVPDRQEEMGRVPIAVERLQQWQSSSNLLAQFIAGKLGLDSSQIQAGSDGSYRLGMLRSSHGRRWATLKVAPLALEVNHHSSPLVELLFVEGSEVVLDDAHIQHMLTFQVDARGKEYVPNTEKRESRKLDTQAMYQEWRDTHAELQRKHPGKDKAWYARKIARLEVARGRDYETIRKRLL